MTGQLWTVAIDRRPVAVVVARHSDEARCIVRALAEYGDLPGDGEAAEVSHCLPADARRTVELARALGCADRFLACLDGRMFLTQIGGLGAAFCPAG
jgi:hypothetical protein